MSTQTPIEAARKEWRKMRHQYHSRKGDPEWRRRYFWLRGHRNTTKDWRRKNKARLADRIRASLVETTEWLQNAQALQVWFDTVMDRLDNDHQKRTLAIFLIQNQSYIEDVQDEMPMVNNFEGLSDDEAIEVLSEEIASYFAGLGLVENEAFNERDDGCLWFTDPETDTNYHFCFALFPQRNRNGRWEFAYDVSSEMISMGQHDFRAYPIVGLDRSATLSNSNLRDITMPPRNYFGAWDGIKGVLQQIIDDGLPLPEGIQLRGLN